MFPAKADVAVRIDKIKCFKIVDCGLFLKVIMHRSMYWRAKINRESLSELTDCGDQEEDRIKFKGIRVPSVRRQCSRYPWGRSRKGRVEGVIA